MPEKEPATPRPLIVDAHLDIAYSAVVLGRDLAADVQELRDSERRHPPLDPGAGTATVSWPALVDGRAAVVGGSIFVDPATKAHTKATATYRDPEEAHQQGLTQLDYYRRVSDERDDVRLVTDGDALDEILGSWDTGQGMVGVFVVMEGADPIRRPDELHWWVEHGLRGVGLAWGAGTRYAGGDHNPGPLSDEGRALVDAMADYNLLLDISHLWEDGAAQVLDRYPGPIVATHANPRAFVDIPRLLSDDMIRRLADRGGVIGVVAYNRFLDPQWYPGRPRVPLARLVEAIDYICQTVGSAAAVGIGSDLDGGFGLESAPAGLGSVADLYKIGGLLRERGYGASDIEAILSGNWLRVMRASLAAF